MKFTFFETIGKLIVRYHSFFEEGIINTLIIAAFAVLFGTILGTLMASMRMSRILPLRWIATAYIEFIRGTPLMVQLMFIFYGLPMAGITLPDISWIPNFSRFSAGIIAMSLNSCAYTAEIIRSFVEKIEVKKPEKVPGTRTKKQTLVIWWNFIGAIDIPEEPEEQRETAQPT